jgi:hypothetical protein
VQKLFTVTKPGEIMVMSTASAIIFGFAAVFLLIAGTEGMSAHERARVHFPTQFRDGELARYAMDTFVWMPALVPRAIRRQYLRSFIFASVSVGLLSLFFFMQGEIFGSLTFAIVFTVMTTQSITRWFKYRRLL